MNNEETELQRRQLERKNKLLRNEITRFKGNIKELERKIEIEKWAITATNQLISKNIEKFIELGKKLKP